LKLATTAPEVTLPPGAAPLAADSSALASDAITDADVADEAFTPAGTAKETTACTTMAPVAGGVALGDGLDAALALALALAEGDGDAEGERHDVVPPPGHTYVGAASGTLTLKRLAGRPLALPSALAADAKDGADRPAMAASTADRLPLALAARYTGPEKVTTPLLALKLTLTPPALTLPPGAAPLAADSSALAMDARTASAVTADDDTPAGTAKETAACTTMAPAGGGDALGDALLAALALALGLSEGDADAEDEMQELVPPPGHTYVGAASGTLTLKRLAGCPLALPSALAVDAKAGAVRPAIAAMTAGRLPLAFCAR